jgi:predicted amidohydrolase
MSDQIDLIAVQCFMRLDDYLTETAFRNRIAELFEKVARARDDSSRPAIVVFPEMIGAFLGFVGNAARIAGAKTVDQAMQRLALGMVTPLLKTMARQRTLSLARGLFLTLAPSAYALYFDVFSAHARKAGAWVVAGSLLLPRNLEGDDAPSMKPLDAQVFNTSLTFDPKGKCAAVTRKVNLVPTQEDVLQLSAGPVSGLNLVDTPAGPLATAICYDGFCEAHTRQEAGFVPLVQRYDQMGAAVVACPSANPWPWDEPWVFNEEGESLLRREQWLAEGLQASMRGLRNVRYGINPMLIGHILDHPFDGRSYIFERRGGSVEILAQAERTDISAMAEEILVATVPVHTLERLAARKSGEGG